VSLVDAPPALLALFVELVELGHDDGESCITIDDVTYGMMPSAKIDSCCSAPPRTG
jgi:hypothetical protein